MQSDTKAMNARVDFQPMCMVFPPSMLVLDRDERPQRRDEPHLPAGRDTALPPVDWNIRPIGQSVRTIRSRSGNDDVHPQHAMTARTGDATAHWCAGAPAAAQRTGHPAFSAVVALLERGHEQGDLRSGLPLSCQVEALYALVNACLRASGLAATGPEDISATALRLFLEGSQPTLAQPPR